MILAFLCTDGRETRYAGLKCTHVLHEAEQTFFHGQTNEQGAEARKSGSAGVEASVQPATG